METNRDKEKGGRLLSMHRKGSHPNAKRDVRFHPGKMELSPALMAVVLPEDAGRGVVRHLCGDWGDVSMEHWKVNNVAVREGDRILSVYTTPQGVRFLVVTDADRSLTRILLAEEI